MSRMDTGSKANSGESKGQISTTDQGGGGAVSQVGDKMREMGSQARQAATQKYEELRNAATEKYEQFRDTAKEYYEHGRERATEWEHGIEDYVREKPVQALLMAAGVGVILGLLWKRS